MAFKKSRECKSTLPGGINDCMKEIQIGYHQKSRKYKDPIMYALVDDEDYEELSRYKWSAQKNGNTFYALRHLKDEKQTTILMHAQIMQTPRGMHTDHIDGNGMNNQRSNLRVCTTAENQMNRGKQSNNTSGFKGVTRYKKQWQAQINVNKKLTYLGQFLTKELAHEAYIEACNKYHGEFGKS